MCKYLVTLAFGVSLSQCAEFKRLGTLAAMSALQRGPGFPVLLPALYDYIATGRYNSEDLTDEDVPDYQVQTLLSAVS